MIRFLKRFECFIITVLICLLALIVLFSVYELGVMLLQDILTHPLLILSTGDLMSLLGSFMLILIGVELIESIRTYLVDGHLHAETVINVAMIALARKIIILDTKEYDGIALIGIGFIILSLGITYYLLKRYQGGTARQ